MGRHAHSDPEQAATEPVANSRVSLDTMTFVALAAGLNSALYNLPLYSFATRNLDLSTFSGVLTLTTLLVLVFLETAIALALIGLVSRRILKPFCMLIAMSNAVALYFLLTYRVVLDETMMGNVLNTDLAEASEFLHPTLIVYLLALGVVPLLASHASSHPAFAARAPRDHGSGRLVDHRGLGLSIRVHLAMDR